MTIKQLLIGTSIAATTFGILWLRFPHEKPAKPTAPAKAEIRHPRNHAKASLQKSNPNSHRRHRPWAELKKARNSEAQVSTRKRYGEEN